MKIKINLIRNTRCRFELGASYPNNYIILFEVKKYFTLRVKLKWIREGGRDEHF